MHRRMLGRMRSRGLKFGQPRVSAKREYAILNLRGHAKQSAPEVAHGSFRAFAIVTSCVSFRQSQACLRDTNNHIPRHIQSGLLLGTDGITQVNRTSVPFVQ